MVDVGDGDERDLELHVDFRGTGVMLLLFNADSCLTHVILLFARNLEPRPHPFKGVVARTSTFSICGGTASNSLARAPNAFAISPLRWVLRPASVAKVSKMPNFPGPSLNAYHFKVPCSFWARDRADFRNASASASLPARASSVANNPIASIELLSCVELVLT